MLARARPALVLAALLVCGCLGAPESPSSDSGDAAMDATAPGGDADASVTPLVGARGTPAALLALAQEGAEPLAPGAQLFSISSEWESSEGSGADSLRTSLTRATEPKLDGRSLGWQFVFVNESGTLVGLTYAATGEELGRGILAGGGVPGGSLPAVPWRLDPPASWMETERLADALQADGRARPAFDEPIRHVSYRFESRGGDAMPQWLVWAVHRGGEIVASVDPETWQVQDADARSGSLPVDVVAVEGVRESATTGIVGLEFRVRLVEDAAEPLDVRALSISSFVPGWSAQHHAGEASGQLRFEGAGDALDPGETLVVSWEPPFGPIGPGEHIALALGGEGMRDASFRTPDRFGDELRVALR